MKKKVVVVIPIYQEEPTALEKISLAQTLSVLNKYPIIFQTKEGLNTTWYEDFCEGKANVSFERFKWDGFMEFTMLSLSPSFYARFAAYEYMLICHLDAFVFRDELDAWCRQGYDYIGSVIYNSKWTNLPTRLGRLIGLTKPEYFANGGFALKKVESFHKLARSYFVRSRLFLWNLRHFKFYQDDIFLSQLFPRIDSKKFNVPPKFIAQKFGAAVEIWDLKDLPFGSDGVDSLPFGTHGWFSYHPEFWKPFIRGFGYSV